MGSGFVRSFHRSGRYRGERGMHVLTVYNVNVDVNEIMGKEGSGGGYGVGSGPRPPPLLRPGAVVDSMTAGRRIQEFL